MSDDTTSLMKLLVDIRFAAGDDGRRMQDDLVEYIAQLRRDAKRYRWLKEKMIGIDFDWQEAGVTALSFEMPAGCAYGGDCDQNIDTAMESHK